MIDYTTPKMQQYMEYNQVLCRDHCLYSKISAYLTDYNHMDNYDLESNFSTKSPACYWSLIYKKKYFVFRVKVFFDNGKSLSSDLIILQYSDTPDIVIESSRYSAFCMKLLICKNFAHLDNSAMMVKKKSVRTYISEKRFFSKMAGHNNIQTILHVTTKNIGETNYKDSNDTFLVAAFVEYTDYSIGFIEVYATEKGDYDVIENKLVDYIDYRIACYLPKHYENNLLEISKQHFSIS